MQKRTKKRYWLFTILLVLGLLFCLIFDPSRHVLGYSVYGIDVSKWQKQVSWKEVSNDRISFVFIKASQGENKADSLFVSNWNESKAEGIIRGAYHYYESSQSGKIQAMNFIKQVNLEVGDLPPVIDLEEPIRGSLGEFQAEVQKCLDVIEAHYQIKPIIYTNPSYYQDYLASRFYNYPIWLARYRKYPLPKLQNHEHDWLFWQFTNTGTVKGIKGNVDLNVFKGSLEELKSITK